MLPEEIRNKWIKITLKDFLFLINNNSAFDMNGKPVEGDEVVSITIVYKLVGNT